MTMERKLISTGSRFEPQIGFSRAVRMDKLIAISGTAPIAADGCTAYPGDLYLQTKRCLEIIKQALEEAGGSIADVVRTRVFLTDISRWREAAKAHGEVFAEIRPASTFVEVSALIDKDWLVEIEADCWLQR